MYSRLATISHRNGQRIIETAARGYDVLRDPVLNKGDAFTPDERRELGLDGLLPDAVATSLEPQVELAYRHYSSNPTDLAKHLYMLRLHDVNETLFYALMQRHLLEMLPVVYDPTVGEAIEHFSEVYTRPRGLFLSIDKPEMVESSLRGFGARADDIDLIVASDAEEILGIGDWGANGIDISIGKLAVYTAAAGIDPSRVLPVVLDVGTDQEILLNDPTYIGYRHGRVTGQEYDNFIDRYVQAARRIFPHALLHWEDFGSTNGRRILNRYRNAMPTFNDDMQGTGAIVMSGLFNALKITGGKWRDQRVVIVGGGTAGSGIADQICDQMVRDGLDAQRAARQIWLVDLPGLLTDDMSDGLLDYQRPYARPEAEFSGWAKTRVEVESSVAVRWPKMAALQRACSASGIISLETVVAEVQPTMLIGASTAPGLFTRSVVQSMANHVARPIIFPLSNPTPLAEATPADLLRWTRGKALIATGSPFDDVNEGGVTFKIGQANNAALYPGLGLGAIVCRAAQVTDEMILAAAKAVADQADVSAPGAALLPSNVALRTTSSVVAVEVAKAAQEQGVAGIELADPVEAVRQAQWWPEYCPVVAV
jgi:malate dehydrogenase (oxaloacetate-decarboxylating)